MTTSDMHSLLYREPLNELNRQQQRLTQQLRELPSSPATATSARKGRSCSASETTSHSYLDPYIRRKYVLLMGPDGRWFANLQGSTLIWSELPDDAQVYSNEQTALQAERHLRELGLVQLDELLPREVWFYAHKARAHLWTAAYV